MKKFIIIISLLLLVSCTQEVLNDEDTSFEPEENVVEEISLLEPYGSLFIDAWSKPGLVNADGSEHIMPEANPVTGKTINVLDFGAFANDSNFDNTEAFNAAIESANIGDEIYIPEGQFYFSTSAAFNKSYYAHIHLKAGVNLRGSGKEITYLVSNYSEDENLNEKTTIILVNSQSNIVISDLNVQGIVDDHDYPDPDVSNFNNFAPGAPVYGIVVDNDKPLEILTNIHIKDVTVEKFRRMGIRIRQSREVVVSDCSIHSATDLGGGGAGYAISIQGMTNGADLTDSNLDTIHNIVENCEITGPYLRHGIIIQYYAHHNVIRNNYFEGTLLDAIDLHGEDEYGNEIAFNEVINTRRGAAVGVGNSGATHDAAGPFNYIHDNVIQGGDRGIDILYGSENTIVLNNKFSDILEDNTTGIFIQNGHGSIVSGNTFDNITGIGVQVLYSYNALQPEVGVPDRIKITNNQFNKLQDGIYVEAHTEDFILEENTFESIAKDDFFVNKNFRVPPISDVVVPKFGDVWYPTDDLYITNESRSLVMTQANMKFKASRSDVPYNRMIYLKFDLTDAPLHKDKVYLKISGKSKDGLATINIHGSDAYLDWNENNLTWETALYHEDQVAILNDQGNETLTHVTDFTFVTVGSEFNTYYIDVTDYVKSLEGSQFTFILANNELQNMYCEIYSKEVSNDDYKLALIFTSQQ